MAISYGNLDVLAGRVRAAMALQGIIQGDLDKGADVFWSGLQAEIDLTNTLNGQNNTRLALGSVARRYGAAGLNIERQSGQVEKLLTILAEGDWEPADFNPALLNGFIPPPFRQALVSVISDYTTQTIEQSKTALDAMYPSDFIVDVGDNLPNQGQGQGNGNGQGGGPPA